MVEEARAELLRRLAQESLEFDATASDPERNCWLVVHRHTHGVLPSEYDIREIDEELYLAVLQCRRELATQRS
jgi:proteasome lid subunit RPN8/RPN11